MTIHFQRHDGKSGCGRTGLQMSEDWKRVKGCKSCINSIQYGMAKQNSPEDHPNFRKALADKADMKLAVTPEQSRIVQEICRQEYVKFADTCIGKKYLSFDTWGDESLYYATWCKFESFAGFSNRQFSFNDDSFVDEIEKVTGIKIEGTEMYNGEYEKVERSACGRTKAEFLMACNGDCSNVEGYESDSDIKRSSTYPRAGWYPMSASAKKESMQNLIKIYGLKIYRIKKQENTFNQHRIEHGYKPLNGYNENNTNKMQKGDNILVTGTKFNDGKYTIENISDNGDYKIKLQEKESKPQSKQYTITEEQMQSIYKIIEGGRHCKMDFTDDFKEMKDNAFALKDMALLHLSNIINKIKGG